jgi:hypothetical protein
MLTQFVDSFKKAVSMEMDAMRTRMGPFEVPLGAGDTHGQDEGRHVYGFTVLQPNDKLILGAECSLITGAGSEHLVEITRIDRDQIVVRCDREIDYHNGPLSLVIYPWFLYEKLKSTLQSLVDADGYHTDTALELFGKLPPRALVEAGETVDAGETVPADTLLNGSQRQAIALSCQRTPAFVWGPPGTGKTTTLGHIITALLQDNKRILITSTTNAAIDQALAKLVELEPGREAVERGEVVRLGQTQAETTHGASLREVVERLNAQVGSRLADLEERQLQLRQQVTTCDELLSELDDAAPTHQLGLFGDAPTSVLDERRLGAVFSPKRVSRLLTLEIGEQADSLHRRRRRLQQCRDLSKQKVRDLHGELAKREVGVVDQARAVFATMTNVYISRLMLPQRFDVVIVEEAGMAVLPTLFYCAALARSQVVMVGDPQQLPPIVQSREPYVYRAMGRSIFAVTVPQPHDNQLVVMLDTQYRMNPRIGDLVGDLFYDGRLLHGSMTAETEQIAAHSPYPGEPLVVLDTHGQTQCATPEGSYSRYNERSAQACVELAQQAVADGIASIAIITPYAEQSRVIRRLLSAVRRLDEHVECRTVHRFQGGERDMVILDTVDAPPLSPGILLAGKGPGSSARNLINVSISRARGKLVIVADVAYFKQHDSGSIVSEVLRRAMAVGTTALLES